MFKKIAIAIVIILLLIGAYYYLGRINEPNVNIQEQKVIEKNNSPELSVYRDSVIGYEIKYPSNWFIDNIDPNHGYISIINFKPGSRNSEHSFSKDDLRISFWAYENINKKSLKDWLVDSQYSPYGDFIPLTILSETDLLIDGVKAIKREENKKDNYIYYIPHKNYILVASYSPNPSPLREKYEKIIESLNLF